MALYLGILLFAFMVTSVAIIPFIDFLYHLQFLSRTSPHIVKQPIPVGGGILMIVVISLLTWILLPLASRFGLDITSAFPVKEELNVIFFTLISFGLLGLYEDILKTFKFKPSFAQKTLLQLILCFVVSVLLYHNLQIHFINLPLIGVIDLGFGYIPFSMFIIFIFTRGFDISDGLDGLASGLLLICLLSFWVLSLGSLDTPLSILISLWIGSLIAFLYFNVWPSRIWLGNSGSLAFGAVLGLMGLLLGKVAALIIIGAPFLIEALFNLTRPKKALHYQFLERGWSEPKIAQRAWLIAAMLSIFGLWLAGN